MTIAFLHPFEQEFSVFKVVPWWLCSLKKTNSSGVNSTMLDHGPRFQLYIVHSVSWQIIYILTYSPTSLSVSFINHKTCHTSRENGTAVLAKSHHPLCSKVNQCSEVTNPPLKDSHQNKYRKNKDSNSAERILRCCFFQPFFLWSSKVESVVLREASSIQSGLISNVNDGTRWPKPQPVSDYFRTLLHISCWCFWSSGLMAVNTHRSIYKETSERNTLRMSFPAKALDPVTYKSYYPMILQPLHDDSLTTKSLKNFHCIFCAYIAYFAPGSTQKFRKCPTMDENPFKGLRKKMDRHQDGIYHAPPQESLIQIQP